MKRIGLFVIVFFCISLLLHASGPRVLFIGDSITDGNWGNACGMPKPTARRLQSSHFQNKRMVVVVDGDIGAGQPYYLMELIPSLVDAPVFGHESTSFKAEFLNFGRNEATCIADC